MRPVGDHAVLLEFESNGSVHIAARLARERFGDSLVEVVPGHLTLLLVWNAQPLISNLKALAHDASAFKVDMGGGSGSSVAAAVTVPVRYDGEDLEAVAAHLGMSSEAVADLHCGSEYTVAFMGFSPGFPYLLAPERSPLLELPRLATPRTKVPAGTVAVAAGYCGIYPRASPGGWNLLGRTELVLFDAGREQPALLEPGTRVRFEAAR